MARVALASELVFVLLTSQVFGPIGSAAEYKDCRTKLGALGICTKISECEQVRGRIVFNLISWGTCGHPLRTCCPIRQYPGCGSGGLTARTNTLDLDDYLNDVDNNIRHLRIVEGVQPPIGSWPWMVAIGQDSVEKGRPSWFCGGTLITSIHILTAAHCVCHEAGRRATIVQLGGYDLRKPEHSGAQEISVLRVICHENYRPPTMYNDIAIVELVRPYDASPNFSVVPICLPLGELNDPLNAGFHGQMVNFAGWGKKHKNSKSSEVLLEIQITVEDRRLCNATMHRKLIKELPAGVTDNLICARDRVGNRDACEGDSGGPLTYRNPRTGQYTVIGIASIGRGCGVPGNHGVYTKVARYVDWIYRRIGFF